MAQNSEVTQNQNIENGNEPDIFASTPGVTMYDTFQDMSLKPKLERGIAGMGFEKPSEIQKQAIMPIVGNDDVIVQAQSGTGKTGTFAIALLQKIDETRRGNPQALVLAPTRELAAQIHDVISQLGSVMGARASLLIGGTPTLHDVGLLQRDSPHIIVGTPGRILDLLRVGNLVGSGFDILIVDEADEVLSSGFTEQITEIFSRLRSGMQIVLVSATIPTSIIELTKTIMKNPVKILVKAEELTLEGIKQYFIMTTDENVKDETLLDLFKHLNVQQSVIFCNLKKRAVDLYEAFVRQDFKPLLIHGDLEQNLRNDVMTQFRSGDGRILITTDLTARGIDVQQVSVVVNYDLPRTTENYIHRIGRSGRFGRKGIAINLILENEIPTIHEFERFYNTTISPFPNTKEEEGAAMAGTPETTA